MSPNVHQHAKSIFLDACDLPPTERGRFLDEQCGADAELRAAVDALLAGDGDARRMDGAGIRAQLEGLIVGVETAAGAPAETLPPDPERIGPYRVIRKLGEGGFGSVFEAEQTEPLRRTVAIKVIKLGMDTRQVIARFETERQALAMMQHPYIARVIDAGATESGRPYFVMELAPGSPITEYCDAQGMDLKARLDLFVGVCRAVQHAHQKGIIHRDLKPSNVLVSADHGQSLPKLIDFGIARAMDGSLTGRTLFTEQGQLIGTPEYMSPEQASGSGDIDTRTDIYSLGILLYELLIGTTPFDRQLRLGASPIQIQRLICEHAPRTPSARLKTLGEKAATVAGQRRLEPGTLHRMLRGDLDWIVMKAIEKDRARRYETVEAFIGDLRCYLNDQAVSARPPTAWYRFRKFARRNRGPLAAAIAIVLLLVGGVVSTSIGLVRAREAESRATAEARNARTESAIARAINAFLNQDLLASVAPEERGKDVGMLEVLDAASQRIEGRFGDQPEVEAAIRLTLGTTYRSLGQYPAAERHMERAYELHKHRAGADAPATLESAVELIDLRLAQGRLDEAESGVLDALERLRRVAGEDHRDTVRTLLHLGRIQAARGLLPEAVASYERALGSARRALGPGHEMTLDAMHGLAVAYGRVERMSEAEPLHLESLAGMRTLHGEAHPTTLAALSDLAIYYQRGGCRAEAASFFMEALTLKRRVLGEEHPDTVDTANGLANLHYENGRLAEAEAILSWTLLALRRSLGADHPRTLTCANTLAKVYLQLKRLDEAEAVCADALARLMRRFGEDPRAIVAMSTLAQIYETQDRYDEAEPLHVRTVELVTQIYGEEHRETMTARNNLANNYQAQGRLEEAESLLADVVAVARNSHSPGHFDLGTYLASQGVALRKLERYEDAEKALLEAHAIFADAVGRDHPRTTRAAGSLVKLYESWNQPDQAARWRAELPATQPTAPAR